MAWRGVDAREVELIQTRTRQATVRGEGRTIGGLYYLLALMHNSLGQHQEALASAERGCEHEDLAMFGFTLVELIEAGARADAPRAAAAALRRLEEQTEASGTEWALGVLARSRALLSHGQAADLLYREAIERLQRCRIAVHLARTHLVYGEWLRRENRLPDARAQLRTAHEMLSRFGAEAFAERARRELLATGQPVRHRAVEASKALTPQESQIARLAADGKTNSEIGAELFISPRTVEWHLRKVFTRLNVDSRSKLRGALADV
jgi:DNA-binding CsgD family transcriptional regulator